jgi:undecaprenyl-diphosphatase
MNLEDLNIRLFSLINAGDEASGFTIAFARICADVLIYLIPLHLISYWLFGNRRRKELALKATLLAFISLGLAQLVIRIYPHPRPFMLGIGHRLIEHAPDSSFPSDHMIVFASVALTLLIGKDVLLAVAVLLAGFIVGWSRIYLGVHFPFDMIGSWLLCSLVAIAFEPLWRNFGYHLSDRLISLYELIFSRAIKSGWVK